MKLLSCLLLFLASVGIGYNVKMNYKLENCFFVAVLSYLALLPLLTFPLQGIIKILPLLILLYMVYRQTTVSRKYLLLSALSFSLVGDFVLTMPSHHGFIIGLCAFLIAHLFYIALFLGKPYFSRCNLALAGMIIIGCGSYSYFLNSHLTELKFAINAYMLVVSLMAIIACLSPKSSTPLKLGAILFICSDATLSYQLFISPTAPLENIILVTYYLAQFYIVTGIGWAASTAVEASFG